ncbi:MAG: tRNA (adenosine(37)-N6)-threonylcarbamoyltransferase complex dimerization subunit type 1 TsaB [Chloroflexota bacterium]
MLLAIDTSTRILGLALYDGAQVRAEVIWHSHNHHTVELAPTVIELLVRTGISIKEVQAVAVALGPGSFTGLRLGLALAKGLATSLNMPLIGIPTLDITAAAQPVSNLPLVAVLQAGRRRLAAGWYCEKDGIWHTKRSPEIITVEKLALRIQSPTIVTGELGVAERTRLARKRKNVVLTSPAHSLRRPSVLAELAWKRWQEDRVDDLIQMIPIYLHYGEAIPE